MNTIAKRAKKILNLKQYNKNNYPENAGQGIRIHMQCPYKEQNVLRCLIRLGIDNFKLPEELLWLKPLINIAESYQNKIIGIRHSFCYITVRHGLIKSKNDDEWHVDGFSMRINHIPEQNYIWSNYYPTEIITKAINLKNFNPLTDNIHKTIQNNIGNYGASACSPCNLYCLDPYVIHRRPRNIPKDARRTFIRISFTPIEIKDSNNTQNPLIPTHYTYDGVKEFRNNLK